MGDRSRLAVDIGKGSAVGQIQLAGFDVELRRQRRQQRRRERIARPRQISGRAKQRPAVDQIGEPWQRQPGHRHLAAERLGGRLAEIGGYVDAGDFAVEARDLPPPILENHAGIQVDRHRIEGLAEIDGQGPKPGGEVLAAHIDRKLCAADTCRRHVDAAIETDFTAGSAHRRAGDRRPGGPGRNRQLDLERRRRRDFRRGNAELAEQDSRVVVVQPEIEAEPTAFRRSVDAVLDGRAQVDLGAVGGPVETNEQCRLLARRPLDRLDLAGKLERRKFRGFEREHVDQRNSRSHTLQEAEETLRLLGIEFDVELAFRVAAREIGQIALGRQTRARQPVDFEMIDLEGIAVEAEIGIDLVGRRTRIAHRAGLQPQIEAIGVGDRTIPAGKEMRQGEDRVEIDLSAFQFGGHRGRSGAFLPRNASVDRIATDVDLESVEDLPVGRQSRLGRKSCPRQRPDRRIDLAGQPVGKSGRLLGSHEQVAVEVEAFIDAEVTGGFDPGAAGQFGRETVEFPASRPWLGDEGDVADRGITGSDHRQRDLQLAVDRRSRHLGQQDAHRLDPARKALPGLLGGSLVRLLLSGRRLAGAGRGAAESVDIDLLALELQREPRRIAIIEAAAAGEDIGLGAAAGLDPQVRDIGLFRRQNDCAGRPNRRDRGRARRIVALLAVEWLEGVCRLARIRQTGRLRRRAHQADIAGELRYGAGRRGPAVEDDLAIEGAVAGGDAQRHRAIVLRNARGNVEVDGIAIDGKGAAAVEGAGERTGRKRGIEVEQGLGATARLVLDDHRAIVDGDVLQNDPGAGRDLRIVGDPPDRVVGAQRQAHRRPFDGHRIDVDFAGEIRRKLGVHAEAADGHQRGAVVVLDFDVVEGDRWKRQQPSGSLALDDHLAAEDRRSLALEIRAIGRPVDEIGRDQRRQERQHEQSTNKDEGPDQLVFSLMFRGDAPPKIRRAILLGLHRLPRAGSLRPLEAVSLFPACLDVTRRRGRAASCDLRPRLVRSG